MKRFLPINLIALAFIFLFSYAALIKLLDHEKFVIDISKSPLLTDYAVLISYAIPSIELICCVMLAFTRVSGLYVAFTLMTLFTVYIIAILQFSYYIPCSCGGILQSMGWKEHLVFNIAFMMLAVLAVIMQWRTHHRKQTTSENISIPFI